MVYNGVKIITISPTQDTGLKMSRQSITIELPDHLYQSANLIARTTKRSLADILQDSLARTLPPLDDVPPEEAEILAEYSMLSDEELWRVAQSNLSPEEQILLENLLYEQSKGELDGQKQEQLTSLQEKYGRLLVHQSHAWLLLARRGYKVPVQNS